MDSSARSLSTGSELAQPVSPWGALRTAWGKLTGVTTLSVGQVGSLPCLTLTGALDRRIAPDIKAQAQAFAREEGGGWAVDLSGVGAWDSEGLRALVFALDVSELAGKQLTVLDPPAALRQTLERAQLHRLFTIVETA